MTWSPPGRRSEVSSVVSGLVPPGVRVVMSTKPAAWAGATAVMTVPVELTVKQRAGVVPKRTAVAPDNPVPETVTVFPPQTGPAVGLTPPTTGEKKVKSSAVDLGLFPPGVSTETSTNPAAPAGETCGDEVPTRSPLKPGPGWSRTARGGPRKFDPVMVTVVPPPLVPVVGLTLVTAAGMDHVKLVELLAPLISSAVTSTVNRPEVVGTPEMSPWMGRSTVRTGARAR